MLQQWHLIRNLILYRNSSWIRLENTELSISSRGHVYTGPECQQELKGELFNLKQMYGEAD